MKIPLIILIGIIVQTAAAQKRRPLVPLETGFERNLGVVYKTVGKRQLAFDVYYPKSGTEKLCPTIVYTHGGGWAAGSRFNAARGSFAPLFKELTKKGFCVVSVDYRLARNGAVLMRDCVIDSKDALRYLVKNSKTLSIDPEKLFVFGDSAGGQIAQMLLLSSAESLPGDAELAGVDFRIAAGVSWYGPCDFEDMNLFNHDDRAGFRDRFSPRITGGKDVTPEEKLQLYREMSPVNLLTKNSPPLLMIQGDKDTTIPVKHAYRMEKEAKKHGAPVRTLIVKNSGHNWRSVDAPIEPTRDEIVRATVDFFVEQLGDAKPSYPEFSWNKVPIAFHFGKSSGLMTSEEAEFVASRSNLICLEKAHAIETHKTTEAGIEAEAQQLKKLNPKMKVIFYWNTFLDYPMYEAHRTYEQRSEWWLRTKDGELDRKNGKLKRYDLSNPELREWWTDVAAKAVVDGSCDGVFMDAFPQVTSRGNRRLWGDEKYQAIQGGLEAVVRETREKIGDDKLIIYNGIRSTPNWSMGFDYPEADAAMMEHFGAFASTSKEAMLADILEMQRAAKAGKIVVFKGWPEFTFLDSKSMRKPLKAKRRLAREHLDFPLACFLAGAQEHCYFIYNWGYRIDNGCLEWYPEFDRPLGKPLGDMKRDAWSLSREFEFASVQVNLETKKARIRWAKKGGR